MNKRYLLLFYSFWFYIQCVQAQLGNTMYGLYRHSNPTIVELVSIDPSTGIITTIGNPSLSTSINLTGCALNPYNLSYSYQDEDSWLSLSLQDGSILSDVVATLPNAAGNFNNFRFNTADSSMYGLFSQVGYDPITGLYFGDMRLATCQLSTGNVNLISQAPVASNYVMAGSAIDPYLMVYYFISDDKLKGIDLYNGNIYSEPNITIPSGGNSFDNFAYSCADTTLYGLIMQNGVKGLGKINASTGIVTPLGISINMPNYIMNGGATIDPINGIYYFESMLNNTDIYLIGLSIADGSIVSNTPIPFGANFDMFRIASDCYQAAAVRSNPSAHLADNSPSIFKVYPNPGQTTIQIETQKDILYSEIINLNGEVIHVLEPGTTQIDISNLSKGVYILKIQSQQETYLERFVKN